MEIFFCISDCNTKPRTRLHSFPKSIHIQTHEYIPFMRTAHTSCFSSPVEGTVVAPYHSSYLSEIRVTIRRSSLPSSFLYSSVTIFQRKIASQNIKASFLVERGEGRSFYQLPKSRLPPDHKVSLKQANRKIHKAQQQLFQRKPANLHAYINFMLLCSKILRFSLLGGFRLKAESTLTDFNVLETNILESRCFNSRITACLCMDAGVC